MIWVGNEPAAPAMWDIADTVRSMVDDRLVSQAEHTIAMLALWATTAVESKHLSPEDADQLFTALDARLTWRGGESPLSEQIRDLLVEGEHFHHFGEELGTNPTEIRRLAFEILNRPTGPGNVTVVVNG